MKIHMMKVADIIAYSKNAKNHPQEQIESLAKQIKELGFTQPLVVDAENNLVIGHGRLAAAEHLELEDVPVVRLDPSLSPERVRALRLYDNKVSETGWDSLKLIEELTELQDMEFDLQLTGFKEFELNALLDVDLGDVGFDIPADADDKEDKKQEPSEGFKQVQLLYKPEEHVRYLELVKKYQEYFDCKEKTTAEVVLMALGTACQVHEQSDEESAE